MKPGDLVKPNFDMVLWSDTGPKSADMRRTGRISKGQIGLVLAVINYPNSGDADAFVVFSGPLLGWTWAETLVIVGDENDVR